MPRFKDLTGEKIGFLTVLALDEKLSKGRAENYWVCKCLLCGNIKSISNATLRDQENPACGCRRGANRRTHGKTNTRLYHIWQAMKARCYRATTDHYAYYGALGISVCDEWKRDFQKFYDWAMSSGYKDSLTIDRIDVKQNYCPENCRWITLEAQARNKRNTILLTVNGVTKTIHEWAEITGVSASLLGNRVRKWAKPENGNYTEKILSPPRESKKVAQYTLGGELIKVWGSTKSVQEAGIGTLNGVRHCCLGDCAKHRGYIWRYIE